MAGGLAFVGHLAGAREPPLPLTGDIAAEDERVSRGDVFLRPRLRSDVVAELELVLLLGEAEPQLPRLRVISNFAI